MGLGLGLGLGLGSQTQTRFMKQAFNLKHMQAVQRTCTIHGPRNEQL
jgi:hypothetical protein